MNYRDDRVFFEALGRIVANEIPSDQLLDAVGIAERDQREQACRALFEAAGYELTPDDLDKLNSRLRDVEEFLRQCRAKRPVPW